MILWGFFVLKYNFPIPPMNYRQSKKATFFPQTFKLLGKYALTLSSRKQRGFYFGGQIPFVILQHNAFVVLLFEGSRLHWMYSDKLASAIFCCVAPSALHQSFAIEQGPCRIFSSSSVKQTIHDLYFQIKVMLQRPH